MNQRKMMIAATLGTAAVGLAGVVALAGFNAKPRDDDDEDERESEREGERDRAAKMPGEQSK